MAAEPPVKQFRKSFETVRPEMPKVSSCLAWGPPQQTIRPQRPGKFGKFGTFLPFASVMQSAEKGRRGQRVAVMSI
eukprot:1178521-Prorocentrum_minimum.AAC.1